MNSGALPITVTAETGGAGVHYYFRAPAQALAKTLGPGVDVIGRGYVVAAPSVHPSGGVYRWRGGLAPGDVDLAEMPPPWLERAKQQSLPPAPAARRCPTSETTFYAALEALDQRRVLECVSGSSLVCGEVFAFRPNSRGGYTLVVNGRSTSNFIDEHGRIGARNTGGRSPDGGPLASTWLRYYRHSDAAIRAGLIELVPELAKFARPVVKPTRSSTPGPRP